jgi:hypothetical protein
MHNKIAIFAAAVILAAPIFAATGGGSSGGGGGGGGHGGASGGVGHSSGWSGRAAAATMRSAGDGHDLSSRAGISRADAMHATHLASGNHAEGEHSTSPGTDHHHHHHPYRDEPSYGAVDDQFYSSTCMPSAAMSNNTSWFDCNRPTKSLTRHKS